MADHKCSYNSETCSGIEFVVSARHGLQRIGCITHLGHIIQIMYLHDPDDLIIEPLIIYTLGQEVLLQREARLALVKAEITKVN